MGMAGTSAPAEEQSEMFVFLQALDYLGTCVAASLLAWETRHPK
jgi:hypothetical protein